MKHLPDVLIIAGAGLTAFGAWQAWPPAGAILSGVFLIVAGILRARA